MTTFAEPQTAPSSPPPCPPAAKLTAVDGPRKPRCKMCRHVETDHPLAGFTLCRGRTASVALDGAGHCTCRRYVKA